MPHINIYSVFCCHICNEDVCVKGAVLTTVETSFIEDLILARRRLASLLGGRQVSAVFNYFAVGGVRSIVMIISVCPSFCLHKFFCMLPVAVARSAPCGLQFYY